MEELCEFVKFYCYGNITTPICRLEDEECNLYDEYRSCEKYNKITRRKEMEINTIKQTKKEKQPGKVIRKSNIARAILHFGEELGDDYVRIIDIKGDKLDPDGKRSCFVFRNDERFQEVFAKVLEQHNASKETRTDVQQKKEIDELKEQIEELKKLVASKEE